MTAPEDPLAAALAAASAPMAHSEAMNQPGDSASLAARLKAMREALLAPIRAEDGHTAATAERLGLALSRELSDIMDAALTRLFFLSCESAGVHPESVAVAIVATGGYGRRELCPFSDIDITFIPHREGDLAADRVIREMFTRVMDVCITRCGLEVGYAYRLLDDCAALDHQTSCGLLDARFITGSSRVFIQFEYAYWSGFNAAEFIFAKLRERERTLARWGATPRVVEPQLKEGPGGLRDLQTAVWLAQASGELTAAKVRGSRSIRTLEQAGYIDAEEAEMLAGARERLFRVRNALHAVAGAERDELVITRQEDVAIRLGYGAGSECSEADTPPVERFMAELYPALCVVRSSAARVMRCIGDSRLLLGIELDCVRREIVPANDALGSGGPEWVLSSAEIAQRYELRLSDALQSRITHLLRHDPAVAPPATLGATFTAILSRTGRVYATLQSLADLGALGWILPEFQAIIDLIPYDPSHDHTVGQHSLLVIRELENLLEPGGDEERLEMRRVYEELPHPEQLAMAALLHDSGKAEHGRPHSEASEEIAVRVCSRLGWSDEATANVCFLVRQHLLMAEISRLRDLSLDDTIRGFTSVVDDMDRLNMLYLLTYADTRAVGQGVWTQVKGRFLRELWRRSAGVLCDEEPLGYDDAAVARARRRLMKDLSLEDLPEEEVAEHVQAMPPHYLLNQSLRQIAHHVSYVRRVREGGPVVEFADERQATFTELTVCAIDDPEPGLLARIAGVLYAADLNVHDAQVMTRITARDRIALDTLLVDFHGRQLSPGKRREVSANLSAALTGARQVADIIAGGRRSSTRKEASSALRDATVRNDLSDSLTVIEVQTEDNTGAFYHVCQALSRLGWDIHSARVSKWADGLRAAYYVAGARRLSEAAARCMVLAAQGEFALADDASQESRSPENIP